MQLTEFDKLEKRLNAARTLETLRPRYRKATQNPNCDKYNLAFGGDDRFAVFSFKLFLDCHTGHYGSSSCFTFASIDSGLASSALNYVLNKHMDFILNEMAKKLREDAKQLHQKAAKQIAEAEATLEQLIQDTQPEESPNEQTA